MVVVSPQYCSLCLLSAHRCPTLEYGSEIWDCNESKANALESIILGGAKKILSCSSRMCNEAVRGDMGLDNLRSPRERDKLKWCYKLASPPEDRFPKQVFSEKWKVKSRNGRQRKTWDKDVFVALGIDKGECLKRGIAWQLHL